MRSLKKILDVQDISVVGQVNIDRMRDIKSGRPIPQKTYLDRMFVAHDLAAISQTKLERAGELHLPLQQR